MSHDLLTYQVIILLIAGLFICRKLVLLLKNKTTGREFLVTALIWLTFAILSLFPNLVTFFGKALGFELGINALLVITTITLFYFVLKMHIRLDRTEQSITKLIRSQAIDQIKSKLSKQSS